MIDIFLVRLGWYRYRKTHGHPISLWRALFKPMPRWGAYDADEPGCQQWALDAYAVIGK